MANVIPASFSLPFSPDEPASRVYFSFPGGAKSRITEVLSL